MGKFPKGEIMLSKARVLLVAVFLCSSLIMADFGQVFNYQGKLADGTGLPAESPVDMTFALYTASTGGSVVWSKTVLGVDPEHGIFSVELDISTGTPTTVDWDTYPELWLQVNVDGTDLSPRERLTSAFHAFNIADGVVNDDKVDWGIGANQVSAEDILLEDVGMYYDPDNVETALQSLGALVDGIGLQEAYNVGDTIHADDGPVFIYTDMGTAFPPLFSRSGQATQPAILASNEDGGPAAEFNGMDVNINADLDFSGKTSDVNFWGPPGDYSTSIWSGDSVEIFLDYDMDNAAEFHIKTLSGGIKTLFTVDEEGNARIENKLTLVPLSSAPAGSEGDLYSDNASNKLYYHDGTGWQAVATGTIESDNIHDADDDTKVLTEESADEDFVRIYTAGNERLTVTNTGLVGIGTDTPQHLLHLSSASYAYSRIETNGDSDAGIHLRGTSVGDETGGTNQYAVFMKGADNSGDFTINEDYIAGVFSPVTRFTIQNETGNVGIGNSSPEKKLDISATDYDVATRSQAVGVTAGGSYTALEGYATGTGTELCGVWGYANGSGAPTNAFGVYANTDGTSGTAYGIYATASGGTSANWAGYFDGDVGITGNLDLRQMGTNDILDSDGDVPVSAGDILAFDGTNYNWQAASGDNDWTEQTSPADYLEAKAGGIAANGAILYGTAANTHINLGFASSETGASGSDYTHCTVGGGYWNEATNTQATVSGGFHNIASGNQSTVGGGAGNTAVGYRAVVAGGVGNDATAARSTIAGGQDNTANADAAFVGGGHANTAGGQASTVGAGQTNTSSANYSTIAGGSGNEITAAGAYGTIGGGWNNTASSGSATISGGNTNTASGLDAVIGGGQQNVASGQDATIAGGYNNNTSGAWSVISGGGSNTITNSGAAIPGGSENTVSGAYSMAFGYQVSVADDYRTVFYDATNPGRLGINNETPATELDVTGTATMTGFSMPTGAADTYVLTSDASGIGTWQPASGVTDADWTINGSDQYSAVAGNVGIGTATPGHKLDVQADDATGERIARIWNRTDAADEDGLLITTVRDESDAYILNAYSGSSSKFFVRSDGNVGIGTTTPARTLDVNGTMRVNNDADFGASVGVTDNLSIGTFEMATGAADGYVLTSDAGGHGTWQPSGGTSQWTDDDANNRLYNDNATAEADRVYIEDDGDVQINDGELRVMTSGGGGGTETWTFDSDLDGWTSTSPCGYGSSWTWDSDGGAGTAKANYNYAATSIMLTSPAVTVSGVATVTLEYTHRYNTESCCDEGFVKYRLDGGAWQLFTPTTGSYNGSHFCDDDPTNGCLDLTQNSYYGTAGYATHSGDIAIGGASTLEITFVATSDISVTSTGWWLDEVSVSGLPGAGFSSTITLADGYVELPELSSSPSTPASSYGRIYGRDDGKVYYQDDGGTEYDLTSGGAGSSNWTLSGSQLYPDLTSYDVGIGTTSPGRKLDVSGVARFGSTSNGNVSMGNDGNAYIELRESDGAGTPYIDFSNDAAIDYDGRIRLTGDDQLAIEGAYLVAANNYLNFGTIGGSGGYGFRSNAGTVQYKNSGGSWVGMPDVSLPGGTAEWWFRPDVDPTYIRPYTNEHARVYDAGEDVAYFYEGSNYNGSFFAGGDVGVVGQRSGVSYSEIPSFIWDEFPFVDINSDGAITSDDNISYSGIYGYGSVYMGVTGVAELDAGVRGIGLDASGGTNSTWPLVGVIGEVVETGSFDYGQQGVYGFQAATPGAADYCSGVYGRTSQTGYLSAGVLGQYTASVTDPVDGFDGFDAADVWGGLGYGGYVGAYGLSNNGVGAGVVGEAVSPCVYGVYSFGHTAIDATSDPTQWFYEGVSTGGIRFNGTNMQYSNDGLAWNNIGSGGGTSLWNDAGNYLYPNGGIGTNLQIADVQSHTYGMYSSMLNNCNTGASPYYGYGGYFDNNWNTTSDYASPVGVYARGRHTYGTSWGWSATAKGVLAEASNSGGAARGIEANATAYTSYGPAYGGHFTASSSGGASYPTYGIYATASGGSAAYAGYFDGNVTTLGKLVVNNSVDGGPNRGIWLWNSGDPNWGIYMGQSGSNRSLANGTATAGASFSAHAIRLRTANSVSQGILFENSSEQLNFSVRASDGLAYFRGNVGIGTTAPSTQLHTTGGVRFAGIGGSGAHLTIDASGNISRTTISGGGGSPGGANGNVQFNSWGSFAGSNNLYWDNGNARLGIGTTGPAASLHIISPNLSGNQVTMRMGPIGGGSSSVSRPSILDFWSTFDNYPADQGPRRTASIRAGFNGSPWGSEYLSFHVGGAGDAANLPTERMRINGNGTLTIGGYTLPATDGSSGQVLKTNGSGTVTWQNDDGGGSGGTPCNHEIWLYDSYGDGWNGGQVDVLVNSIVVLDNITLSSGSGPGIYTFSASSGDAIQVQWVSAGTWPSEMSFNVYDGTGAALVSGWLYADGTWNGTGNCPSRSGGHISDVAYGEGSGRLVDGEATISFGDDYIGQLRGRTPKVMVMPTEPCGVLYVAEKDATSFTVREHHGVSNASFDWIAVAKDNPVDSEIRPERPTIDPENRAIKSEYLENPASRSYSEWLELFEAKGFRFIDEEEHLKHIEKAREIETIE